MSDNITIKSSNLAIEYSDTKDHFNNAVLRLLSLSEQDFIDWIELSSNSSEKNIIDMLCDGFSRLKISNSSNIIVDVCDNEECFILCESIAENPKFGIATTVDGDYGWLIKKKNGKIVREISPPKYEEEYFEGDLSAGGYGKYINQEAWRIEKSKRQVSEIINSTGLNQGLALDLGCGYGYFRKALDDSGFNHYGIEISKHAVNVSKSIYGFDTMQGTLSDHSQNLKGKFDLVTLWDVLEHVSDPLSLLKEIHSILKPGGFVVIKTPNLSCPEVDIFGPYYHSFKREHLVYFSNNSLSKMSNDVGFTVHKSTSISHLLNGFVGTDKTKKWSNNLQGTDLVMYLKKE